MHIIGNFVFVFGGGRANLLQEQTVLERSARLNIDLEIMLRKGISGVRGVMGIRERADRGDGLTRVTGFTGVTG